MRWAILGLALTLAACVSPGLNPAQTSVVQAEGRLSITTPDSTQRGGFVWSYQAQRQTWELFGPTGTRVGVLTQTPNLALWTPEKGDPLSAPTLDTLLQTSLGVLAPLDLAPAWLLSDTALNEADQIQQGTWQVTVKRRNDQGFPELVDLEDPDHRLRLKVNTWQGR